MEDATKIYDREGNVYTIAGSQAPDDIILKDKNGGIRIINVKELNKSYSFNPPEVVRALEGIIAMLKSGELTLDALRKLSDEQGSNI